MTTNLAETIRDTLMEVLRESELEIPALEDSTTLKNLGIDSMSFSILVARLDGVLGIDPLSKPLGLVPETLGELIDLYNQYTSES